MEFRDRPPRNLDAEHLTASVSLRAQIWPRLGYGCGDHNLVRKTSE